jgi:solute:Na+ symporter, SSS family
VVDIHKQFTKKDYTAKQDYTISKWYSLGWGIFCIAVAQFAGNMGSLIEAVNVLGSLFYGVILGIFLVAFYCRWVGANAAFWAAVIVELWIFLLFWKSNLGFLWLTAIGALAVVGLSIILELFQGRKKTSVNPGSDLPKQ